jgi:hypothetical protein
VSSFSFACWSIAEILVCAGDEQMVLWTVRLEAQFKCGALEKDLKEEAAPSAGWIEDLLAEALLS